MPGWVCADCGAQYDNQITPCKKCASENLTEIKPDTDRIEDTAHVEYQCTSCGERHLRNNPPCNTCGAMDYETIRKYDSQRTPESSDTGGGWFSWFRSDSEPTRAASYKEEWSMLSPPGPFRKLRHYMWHTMKWSIIVIIVGSVFLGLFFGAQGIGAAVLVGWILGGVFSTAATVWVVALVVDNILGYLKHG